MKTLPFALTALLVLAPIKAHASLIIYTANLNGPSEFPPNASPGMGNAEVIIDDVLNTMEVIVSFSGLVSGTTASHIHCCTAIPGAGTASVATTVPTFPGFPLGVTSGTYHMTFDLTLAATYNPAFVAANGGTQAGAEIALLNGMAAGETYLNIHTASFGGGEIRGFLQPAAVPEPGTMSLMGVGALVAVRKWRAATRRRRV